MAEQKKNDIVRRGLWILEVSGVENQKIKFGIFPQSVDYEVRNRVSQVATQGGWVYIPWYSPMNWSGIDKIILKLTGVGNIFKYREGQSSASVNKTILETALSKVGLTTGTNFLGAGFTSSDRKKIDNAVSQQREKSKSSYDLVRSKSWLLDLFRYVNQKWVEQRGNELVYTSWKLTWCTPLISGDMYGDLDMVTVKVMVEAPMVFTERAEAPWMPRWSVSFSIIGGEIESFMNKLESWSLMSKMESSVI